MFCLALGGAGCGEGPQVAPFSSAAALQSACASFAEALCRRRAECDASCRVLQRYGDEDDCEEIEQTRCTKELALAAAAPDAEGVREARDAVAEASCETLREPVRVTRRAGSQQRGERCGGDAECDEGLSCDFDGAACGGTCQPGVHPRIPRVTGGSCGGLQSESRAAIGEECGGAYMLPSKPYCEPDALCAVPPGTSRGFYDGYGRCVKRPLLGEACDGNRLFCPDELLCEEGTCVAGRPDTCD